MSSEIDKITGEIRIRLASNFGTMPGNGEEPRTKHRCMANTILYAKLKHTTRAWLQDLDVDIFRQFTDFLMGPLVAAWRRL